jgi:hypothetical protein
MPDNTPPSEARARASARAEAWVHGVLNPLMDTLPAEVSLLERGNVTFNCDTGGLRHIHRVEDSLTAPARHVLRDLLRANPDAQEPIRNRDAAVDRVATDARAAFDSLVQNDPFRAAVKALAEPRAEHLPSAPSFAVKPRLEFEPERLVRAFGEFVVNRRAQITDFESDFAPIWNRERARLLAHRVGDLFVRCDEAAQALLDSDRRLIQWLQDKSFEFCERFDIAAAPIGEGR